MFPNRVNRVAEAIQEILATVIHDSVKDPGIPEVFTITRVEVTRDMRIARVHFSHFPDDAETAAGCKAALERARGYLRRELGQRMPVKYLPSLEFFFDGSPAYAQHIAKLLNDIQHTPPPAEEPEKESEEPQ